LGGWECYICYNVEVEGVERTLSATFAVTKCYIIRYIIRYIALVASGVEMTGSNGMIRGRILEHL
jgi:hypothetical protein